jgi:membrane protease YdiL (CAAX protease family)
MWVVRLLQRGDYASKTQLSAACEAQRETLVHTVDVPSPGTVRVVICPAENAAALSADATQVVLRSPGGRQLTSATLTADRSRANRCLDALMHTAGRVRVFVVASQSNAPRIKGLEVFAHHSITPWLACPVLAWLLGFSLLLFVSKHPQTTAVSLAPEQDIVIPARWPMGWLFAIGAYVFVHIATVLFTLVLMLVRKVGPATMDGVSLGLSTLVQHGMLIVISLILLGAWSKPVGAQSAPLNWYSAAGFRAFTKKGVALSVLAAAVLVAVAVGCTMLIPELSKSPMGQILERAPARYAIAFGALIAPLSEELYFRGVLVTAFGRKNIWFGVLGSVLFFTAAHVVQLWGSWFGLIPICAVGITNAIIRAKSGGLEQPWLIHTLYNGALTVSLYFTG